MSRRELVLLWHIHQPFFVPDEEVAEQVVRSYRPLLELHRELDMPFGLNVCGGLLDRLVTIAPDWIELLGEEVRAGRVELLGSGKFHPLLPLLPRERARAQIVADAESKRAALGACPAGFWPTDLGWTHWLVPLLRDSGYRWVVVDSSAVVAASILPGWRPNTTMGHRVLEPELAPLASEAELGEVYRLRLGDAEIFALPRHHERSWDLVDQQEGLLHDNSRMERALDRVEEHYRSGSSLLVIGDDGERVHPQTLVAYRRWLEALGERGIELVTGSSAVNARAEDAQEIYLPTSTFLVDFAAWLTTPDDFACLRHLEEVERRFEEVARRVRRSGDTAARIRLDAIDARLLAAEDSGFYFWKYLRRTREPFLAALQIARAELEALDDTL